MTQSYPNAMWAAFERGQEDARNRKPSRNPYPYQNVRCYDAYEQGYSTEFNYGT